MASDMKAGDELSNHLQKEWQAIASAPFDCDMELAVIDRSGTHALVFPCRRVLRGWINARTRAHVDVYPTHWRAWSDAVTPAFGRPLS